MKIERYKMPKSSFLSVDKDISRLCDLFLSNERLCRLLYYDHNDPMHENNVEDKGKLLSCHYIRTMPKVPIEKKLKNYIVISFDNFIPTTNPEFRDNVINIEIMCNYDCWQIADCQLRPYRIAGEIDSMLDGAKLSGIGTLQFVSANQIIIEGNWGGLSLTYLATHGEDDKKKFENPADEEQFLQEFAEMIDNGQ